MMRVIRRWLFRWREFVLGPMVCVHGVSLQDFCLDCERKENRRLEEVLGRELDESWGARR